MTERSATTSRRDDGRLIRRIEPDVEEGRRRGTTRSAAIDAAASAVRNAIDGLRAGRMLVLTGGAHRPDCVDLVVAADFADAAAINRMTRDARGIVCLALPAARCAELGLRPMRGRRGTAGNDDLALTVSIESRSGVTTGISAEDRARTVAVASSRASTAEDLVSPGHVFPVRAHRAGVLGRAGRPEAALALAQAAGLADAAVLCAVMDDDGTMMPPDAARAYAVDHGFLAVDVADVVADVSGRDRRVAHVGTTTRATAAGPAAVSRYVSTDDGVVHAAITIGAPPSRAVVPVRVWRGDVIGDAFGAVGPTGPTELLRGLRDAGGGVVVYLGDRAWAATPARHGTALSDDQIVAAILADRGVHAPAFGDDR